MIKSVLAAMRRRGEGPGTVEADVDRLHMAFVDWSDADRGAEAGDGQFAELVRETGTVADRWGGPLVALTVAEKVRGAVCVIASEQVEDNASRALRDGQRFAAIWARVAFGELPGRVSASDYLDAFDEDMVPVVPQKGPVAACLLGELLQVLSIVVMQVAARDPHQETRLRPASIPAGAGQEEFAAEWAAVMATAERMTSTDPTVPEAMRLVRELNRKVLGLADWWGMDRVQGAFLAFLNALAGNVEPETERMDLLTPGLPEVDAWFNGSQTTRDWLSLASCIPEVLPMGRTATAEQDEELLVGLTLISHWAHRHYGTPGPAVLPAPTTAE